MPEPIQTVAVTTLVPKESKEMVDALVSLVAHFKYGGDLAGATLLLPGLLSAVEGVGKIAEEVKSEQNDELVGYTVQKVMALLKPKAVVTVPV